MAMAMAMAMDMDRTGQDHRGTTALTRPQANIALRLPTQPTRSPARAHHTVHHTR